MTTNPPLLGALCDALGIDLDGVTGITVTASQGMTPQATITRTIDPAAAATITTEAESYRLVARTFTPTR